MSESTLALTGRGARLGAVVIDAIVQGVAYLADPAAGGAKLAARDGLLIDVEPAQLSAELVNRYRAVKRSGLL